VSIFNIFREIPVKVEEVFAAISDPKRLARWWGPTGFTNTINVFEFKNGGSWSYIMHGPDGKNYKNESVFSEIEVPKKIVIEHKSLPKYRLTILLTPSAKGTLVSWSQEFENPKVAKGIEHIVVPANEQNLDRLTSEVLKS
jgi:uncharacterized protein YndB with AHSA1/START domain